MKRIFTIALMATLTAATASAQGWPADYRGVMLQGFYWDSYSDTKWTRLTELAEELAQYFDLIWIPQSGWCNSAQSMGYDDRYWYNQRSAFGSEAELKRMIQTFKERGTGIIADVVINHRYGNTRWSDFPAETNPLDGKEYSMTLADICSTDEYNTAADAASERSQYGAATGAKDTGDDFNGGRDLDHTSANVQENCKAYTKFLLDYMGYTGFRYDMAKGYGAQYVGLYNAYSKPQFSVGEYWDGKSAITKWIDGTAADGVPQSGAFDFPQKFLLNSNPTKYGSWYSSGGALATDKHYCQYGVTFVDNHDTYRDSNKYKGDVPAANAWILALPGTPCVFLPHWQQHKQEIKAMIATRKAVGVSNTSEIESVPCSTDNCLIAAVKGEGDKRLIVAIGDTAAAKSYISRNYSGFKLVCSGEKWAYYANISVNDFSVSQPSGTYYGSVTTQIKTLAGTTVVYTTDGTAPTAANGTQVKDGTADITFSASATLKAGILIGGEVTEVRTYNYEVKAFEPYKVTVYVNCDEWADNLCFYAWDNSKDLLGEWPGTKASQTTVKDGKTWHYATFDITAGDYTFNFIFNHGGSQAQTVDITGINSDRYYTLGTLSGGKYEVNDVTEQHTSGISSAAAEPRQALRCTKVFTVDGRLLRSFKESVKESDALKGLPRGVYIVNNKKKLVR